MSRNTLKKVTKQNHAKIKRKEPRVLKCLITSSTFITTGICMVGCTRTFQTFYFLNFENISFRA